MTEYGLPSTRDKDGNLQAVDHSFTFDGDEVTIKLRPPTISEFEEFEELMEREEVDPDEVESIIRRHIVEPNIPEGESLTFREIAAYSQGIQDHAMGGSGVNEEIVEQLDDLQDDAGN